MNRIVLTLSILFLTYLAFGQELFYGSTEEDFGRSIQQTDDYGYIITGFTLESGDADIYLIKTDTSGIPEWERTYGGSGTEHGLDVVITPDGGYAICGYTTSYGEGIENAYLVRVDSNGDTLWTKTYGGTVRSKALSLSNTNAGGFIMAGYTTSFGAGSEDMYIINTDANGDTLWTKTFGGVDWDRARAVKQRTNDNFIIAGSTASFGNGNDDFYVLNLTEDGDTIWTKTFGGINAEHAWDVAPTSDGGFAFAGSTRSHGAGQSDVYILKTNFAGDSLWAKFYGTSDIDEAYSIQELPDKGFMLCGFIEYFTSPTTLGSDLCALRLNSSGDTLWTRTFGGNGLDRGQSVIVNATNGTTIVGTAEGLAFGKEDVYVVELDSIGNLDSTSAVPQKPVNFLTSLDKQRGVLLYPNPATTSFEVYRDNFSEYTFLTVYNSLGEIVLESHITESNNKISTKGFDSGLYFVQLKSSSGTINEKLVIRK